MRRAFLLCAILISVRFIASAQSFGVCAGLSKTQIRSQFLTDPSGTVGVNLGFINFIPISDIFIYQDFTINTLGMTATLYEFDEDYFGNPLVITHPDEKLGWFSAQYSIGPTFAYEDGQFYGGGGLSGCMIVPSGGAFDYGTTSSYYFVTSEPYAYSVVNLSTNMFGFFGGAYIVGGGGTETLKLHLKYNLMFTNLAKTEYNSGENKLYSDVLTISLAYLFM